MAAEGLVTTQGKWIDFGKMAQLFEVTKAVWELIQSGEAASVKDAVESLIANGRAYAWEKVFGDVSDFALALAKIVPMVEKIIEKYKSVRAADVTVAKFGDGAILKWLNDHKEEIAGLLKLVFVFLPLEA